MVGGITWARGAIFLGSDAGSLVLRGYGFDSSVASTLPPLVTSAFVQVANQPLVRSTTMLQDPACRISKTCRFPTLEVLRSLWVDKGVSAWWRGTNVSLVATVPKYVVAIAVKDWMEERLPPAEEYDRWAVLWRTFQKATAAGLAGTIVTQPFDVLRNEMFRYDEGSRETTRRLFATEGSRWLVRGFGRNVLTTPAPIVATIVFTDLFSRWRRGPCMQ